MIPIDPTIHARLTHDGDTRLEVSYLRHVHASHIDAAYQLVRSITRAVTSAEDTALDAMTGEGGSNLYNHRLARPISQKKNPLRLGRGTSAGGGRVKSLQLHVQDPPGNFLLSLPPPGVTSRHAHAKDLTGPLVAAREAAAAEARAQVAAAGLRRFVVGLVDQ